MKPQITLVTLGVADLERSTVFYRDGLGFQTHGDIEGVIFFRLNGTQLSLFPRENLAKDAGVPEEGSGFRGITLAHNVESEAEVEKIIEEARRAGAVIVKEPEKAEWGGYHGYFSDPDGFLWEVAYPPLDVTSEN